MIESHSRFLGTWGSFDISVTADLWSLDLRSGLISGIIIMGILSGCIQMYL